MTMVAKLLVESMSVTDEEVSTVHRRKDLDLL